MAVDDDMRQGSIILNSLESKQSGDMLSPEDMAWVDSCLIKDPEIFDSGWSSLKDALLEILNSQPDSVDSSSAGNGCLPSETDIEIIPYCDEEETLQFSGKIGKAFLSNYNDGPKESEDIHLGFSAYEMEQSTEDIFRVWDLDIPTEEDELVKLLNKALTESSSQSVLSTFNDSGPWKDLKSESLDDLVASIADLSLNKKLG